MAEHSPLPWEFQGASIVRMATTDPRYIETVIATLSSPHGEEQRDIDAAYIVLAANSYPAMREALEAVRDALHDFDISTEEREDEEKLSPREILDALTSFVVGVRHALSPVGERGDMSARNDGGPAFPSEITGSYSGMSLRDWFAGQALAGLGSGASSSAFSMTGLLAEAEESGKSVHKLMAESAYLFADAMIAEREKGGAS